MALSDAFTIIGVIIIVHAGYSTSHFKNLLLNSVHIDISTVQIPPPDVLLECIVGFGLAMLGLISSTKPLKKAVSEGAAKQDEPNTQPEFYVFNHAGRAFRQRMKKFGS
ncbi:unnamed protein product [Heterosigma akashiwo]|mmetsp:Transcript_47367/g.69258  ORF Transcript_47367/g.69258 Transcript_47367/m.69258 type:complete len:109 (+) Transcript_47367:58-384(+)